MSVCVWHTCVLRERRALWGQKRILHPPELKVCKVMSYPARFLGRKSRHSEKAGSWAILTIKPSLHSLFMHLWECSVSTQPECRGMDKRGDFQWLSFEHHLSPSDLCVWTLSLWLAELFGNVEPFPTGDLAGRSRHGTGPENYRPTSCLSSHCHRQDLVPPLLLSHHDGLNSLSPEPEWTFFSYVTSARHSVCILPQTEFTCACRIPFFPSSPLFLDWQYLYPWQFLS